MNVPQAVKPAGPPSSRRAAFRGAQDTIESPAELLSAPAGRALLAAHHTQKNPKLIGLAALARDLLANHSLTSQWRNRASECLGTTAEAG